MRSGPGVIDAWQWEQLGALFGDPDDFPEGADWFDEAAGAVIDRSHQLLDAASPRAVEESVASILGAELHRVTTHVGANLRFESWLRLLADTTLRRLQTHLTQAGDGGVASVEDDPGGDRWRGLLRLLFGLAAIAPAVDHPVVGAFGRARKAVAHASKHGVDTHEEVWLGRPPRGRASGAGWRLHHRASARVGYVIEVTWPDPAERHFLLVVVDACGVPVVADAGTFDHLEDAANAWARTAGVEGDVAPALIEDTADYVVLTDALAYFGYAVRGDELSSVFTVWYLLRRRALELAPATRKRGVPLPVHTHRDDINPVAVALLKEFGQAADDVALPPLPDLDIGDDTHDDDGQDDREGVYSREETYRTVIHELRDTMHPGTEHVLSEHRIEWVRDVSTDHTDRPGLVADLLTAWVTFLANHTNAPDDLTQRCLAVARGSTR